MHQNAKLAAAQQSTGDSIYQNVKHVQDAAGIVMDHAMLQAA